MNFSDLKRRFFLPTSYLLLFFFSFSSVAVAADIQAQLDTTGGGSGVSVQDSGGNEKARIDSNGNLIAHGNVGVGTVNITTQGLNVGSTSQFNVSLSGAISTSSSYTQSGTSLNQFTGQTDFSNTPFSAIFTNGNVGIGSQAPGQILDVQGVVRTTGLTMSGAAPVATYVLTATDSAGDTTWTAPGNVAAAGWTLTGNNVYTTTGSENVGIGTTTPQNGLAVMNGGLGIGTWVPNNGIIVASGAGNVGIGSTAPGSILDIQGTARTTGFTMSGAAPVATYVLTATDSAGDTTWTAPGNVAAAGWTLTGNNVYTTNGSSNVGIGTTTPQGSLVVTNGNVGIGTWVPSAPLTVGINAFTVTQAGAITAVSGITNTAAAITNNNAYTQTGTSQNTLSGQTAFTAANVSATFANNVGIGTTTPQNGLAVMNGGLGIGTWVVGAEGLVVASNAGNVGIGSTAPGSILDIQGTARTTGLTMSGEAPVANYVLTATDSAGDTTWTAPGNVAAAGWTLTGNNVYTTNGGSNVGIGTTTPQGGLVVTNGNVGIGTWVPTAPLTVGINAFTVTQAGAITAVSGITNTAAAITNNNAYTQTGTSQNTLSGQTAFTAANVSATFANNVGIGTTTPQNGLAVMNGGLGIGTWVVGAEGLVIAPNAGNVGIGSTAPGSILDIQGTARTTGLTMSGQAPVANYVLTATDSAGDTTWTAPGNVAAAGWTLTGTNVYTTTGSDNVGIGTTTPQGGLVVTNGNVGIGTWVPSAPLTVGINAFTVNQAGAITAVSGITNTAAAITNNNAYTQSGSSQNTFTGQTNFGANVGIGTTTPQNGLVVMNGGLGIGTWVVGAEGLVVAPNAGNVGIGSTAPGSILDIQGTARTTGLTMSGQAPVANYVLTATDSAGDTTWTAPGNVAAAGWTLTGNEIYTTTNSNNVGIGTAAPTGFEIEAHNVGIGTAFTGGVGEGALTVMNGNVGIGTWLPGDALDVIGNIDFGTPVSAQGTLANNTLKLHDAGAVAAIYNNSSTASTALGVYGGKAANSYLILQSTLSATGSGDYIDFEEGNVGVGTVDVMRMVNGNIGIGTTTPAGGLAVMNGNVGIGTWVPGQILDVTGTVRTTGLTMSGQAPVANYVLTATDSAGDTTWTSPGNIAAAGWTLTGNEIYTTTNSSNVGIGTGAPTGFEVEAHNVGIGTAFTNTSALTVMSGDVGIGTWIPAYALDVKGTVNAANFVGNGAGITGVTAVPGGGANAVQYNNGTATTAGLETGFSFNGTNVGIGTTNGVGALDVAEKFVVLSNGNVGIGTFNPFGGSLIVHSGNNVGIGSLVPGQILDVQGTIRTTGLTMSGAAPAANYVLTSTDSAGDTSWTSPGNVAAAGWTLTGNEIYTTTNSNNVGIGTAAPTGFEIEAHNVGIGTAFTGGVGEGALTVMNGNVGIGTWVPANTLDVKGGANFTYGGQTFTLNPGTSQANFSYFVSIGGTLAVNHIQENGGNAYIEIGGGNGENIGITTSSPGSMLSVLGGESLGAYATNAAPSGGIIASNNVGIGTVSPFGGGLIVLPSQTGNVGIGSLVPGQILDVQGTIRTTGLTMSGAAPVANYVLTATDSAGDTTWTAPGNVSAAGWTQTGSEIYTTTNSNNVGIGTGAPTGFEIEAHNVGIGTAFTGGVGEGALTVMNGNVGIGTWVPTKLLQVGPYFTVDSSSNVSTNAVTFGGIANSVDTYGYQMFGKNAVSSSNTTLYIGDFQNGTWSYTALEGGNVGVGTSLAGNQFSVNGAVGIGTANSYYVNTVAAPSGGMIVQGNVGIGTWLPGQIVDVLGTVRTTGFTMSGAAPAANYVLTSTDSAGDTAWVTPGTIGSNYWNYTASGNIGVSTTAAVGIGTTFIGGTGEAALSVMNGNVGIGTWVPGALLQVGGTQFSNNSMLQNGGDYIEWANTSGIRGGSNYLYLSSTSVNSAATSNIFLDSHGNIGIDTIVPLSQLNINGGVGIGTSLTNGAYLNGNSAPSGGLIVQNNVGIGTFNPFGGNLIVNGGGNVGIGSLTPGVALDVNGTIRSTTGGFTFPDGSTQTSAASGGNSWSMASGNVYTTTASNNVGIGTSSPTGFEIENHNVGIGTAFTTAAGLTVMNGNVGIGTWVPGGKLVVSGSQNTAQVDQYGHLLIGNVTTPSYGYLMIQGDATAQGGSGMYISDASGYGFNIGSLTATNSPFIQATEIGVTNNTPIAINPSGGHALIGTFTDNGVQTLQVNGTSYFSGNVSIETSSSPQASGLVVSGNVGIGTIYNNNAGLSIMNGNVGIGTWVPGQTVDVRGTVRTTGFTMSGAAPVANYVLTATDSAGDTTWTAPGNVSAAGWSLVGNEIYTTTNSNNVGIGTAAPTGFEIEAHNVGIGTAFTGGVGEGALTVMSGNVGIGTWVPAEPLSVNGTAYFSGSIYNSGTYGGTINLDMPALGQVYGFASNNVSGNLAMYAPDALIFQTQSYGGTNVAQFGNGYADNHAEFFGNVGIGTIVAGNTLSVIGNVGIGAGVSSPFVNTAAPSGGLIVQNNVGIGTTNPQGALTVMNGNVGIGTWVPSAVLSVSNASVTDVPDVTFTNTAAESLQFILNTSGSNYPIIKSTGGTIKLVDYYGASISISNNTSIDLAPVNGLVTASIAPANSYVLSNVGIGTTTPVGGLSVMNGNVGIGTWVPGQAVDVIGTVRTTGFTMSGAAPAANYVLTATDSAGDTAWVTPGTIGSNYWTLSTSGNIGISTVQNVGIGTSFVGGPNEGAFTVMNGNVGIGTWLPGVKVDIVDDGASYTGTILRVGNNSVGLSTLISAETISTNFATFNDEVKSPNLNGYGGSAVIEGDDSTGPHPVLINPYTSGGGFGNVGVGTSLPSSLFEVGAQKFDVLSSGNVGIGTTSPAGALTVMSGNVGIGTWVPGQTVDVVGTVRTTGFTMSGAAPAANYVLTATDSAGDTAWVTPGTIGSNYWTLSTSGNIGISTVQNVGIGTSFVGGPNEGALSVMNGNVGIGTWVTPAMLTVGAYNNGQSESFNGAPIQNANTLAVGNGIVLQYPAGVGSLSSPGVVFYQNPNIDNSIGYIQGGVVDFNGNDSDLTVQANTGRLRLEYNSGGSGGGDEIDVYKGIAMGNFASDVDNSINNAPLFDSLVIGGNVGIGTNYPANQFVVNGGVGIGTGVSSSYINTVAPAGGMIVQGNVGIGTWLPSAPFQVNGSSQNVTVNSNGNVGIGITATLSPFDIYTNTNPQAEIRNSSGGAQAMIRYQDNTGNYWDAGMNNVTNTESFYISYNGSAEYSFLHSGNLGIGTTTPAGALTVMNGNVGIGTWVPGQTVDVIGTVRTTGFTMSGAAPAANYVLTSTDSAGDTSWTAPGNVSAAGWTQTGTNIYETGNNIGIGTAAPTAGALEVEGGNVGIGTWKTSSTFSLNGSLAFATKIISASTYSALATDNVILANAGSNAIAITLPGASTVIGREYVIKKTDGTANVITITASSGNIDGQTNAYISVQYQSLTIISDGTNWDII